MNNDIKAKQISILLLLVVPGGKFLSLPSMLAKEAGRDAWLAVLLLFLVDFLCLAFVLWGINRNKSNMTFMEILSRTITKVGAKIVIFMLFIFYVLRLVGLAMPTFELFTITFSTKINWLAFVLVLSILTVFCASLGLNALARFSQVMAVLVCLALASIIVFPMLQLKVNNLLPVLEDGFGPVGKSMWDYHLWFSDYFFIYLIMDKIKDRKGLFTNNLIMFSVGVLLTLAMNILFTSHFGELGEFTNLGLSKLSQFSIGMSSNGRTDWLSLSVWILSIFIKLTLLTFSAYRCLHFVIGAKKPFIIWLSLPIVAFYLMPLFVATDDFFNFASTYLGIPYLLIQYVLPLLLPFLVAVAHKNLYKNSHQLSDSTVPEFSELNSENLPLRGSIIEE